MKQKQVAFTIVDDRYYYPVGTHIFINTFKKFHPDIPLVVFRQDTIDKVMVDGVNFYNAKPTFAKLLTDKYDKIVNIDSDTIILNRLIEVFDSEWEVGGVWNFNDYENASFDNIMPEMYVQAGMVGSANKRFWDIWEEENKKAMQYIRQENDVLNLVWYNHEEVKKMNRVIWDKDKNYLGCKSLGREHEFYLENKKVMCRGEIVKAYHWARGGGALPKMQWDRLPFKQEIREYLHWLSKYGTTVKYE